MNLTSSAAADVVFAQKATAIVKSAGMDPKAIDLETFRLNAPLIFSHAYSAIFREELYTVLHENSSMEDKILNAQLVLDGLYSRTRIPLLQQIKGTDICYDTNRAVDVVVHVLFSEGQRLWLEKLKQKSSPSRAATKAAVDPSNSSSSSIELQQLPQDTTTTSMLTTKVNSSAVAHNQQHSDYDDDDFHSDDVLEEQIRSSWKDLHELRESSKHKQAYVSPHDMEQLISRIAYLEDRLKRRKLQRKKKKKNMLLMLPGSHRMRYTKDSDNDAERRIDDDTRQVVGVVPAIAMPKKRRSKRTNKAMDALLRDLDDTQQQDIHRDYDYHHPPPPNIDIDTGGVWQGKAMTSPRRQRPRSAPVIRRVRNYTPRLYSVKKALDPQEVDQQVDKKTSPPPPKYNENGEEYTYDLNGRRILLSQAQLAAEERRRMMEAMGAMLMLQTGEMEYASKPRRPSSAPSSPVRYQAQYPSKSIGANVGNWLKRMGHPKSSSDQPEKPVEGHTKTQMQPRYFGAYEKMEALDLIFSIEYCHSCECHNTTTRHKAEEYFQKTSSYCQLLAEMSHQLGVSARVGVTRIKADVSNNIAGAASSRVGAFEIQVAFKSTSDRVTPTILHSKILTGHWPSKSVLEKRLRAYVAKVRVPSHPSRGIAAPPSIYGHDCPQEYPIGEIMWDYSPLSSPDWEFPIFSSNNGGTPSSSSQKKTTVISNVQWAFDMREMVTKNRVSHHHVSTEQPPLRSTEEEEDDEVGEGGGGADSAVLRALEQEVGTPTKETTHVATTAAAAAAVEQGLDAGIEKDPSAVADGTMIDDPAPMKEKGEGDKGELQQVSTDESKALVVDQITGAEEDYEAIFEDDI